MMRNFLAALAVVVAGIAAPAARAAEDIRFWHAMNGALGAELDALAARYNASQKDYRVIPVYKGGYDETLAAALAARKGPNAPHIVQVYEVGTADLMAEKGAVQPLWQAMAEAGERLDPKGYVPAVAAYFSDTQGRLLALPFNSSTPVLFYNRDAFRKARLDPASVPKSWYGMAATLGALVDAGAACAFTSAWPAWVLLENMSAWHNQEFASPENGMNGHRAKLVFNGQLMVRWVSMLSSWLKSGYFTYAGRANEAEERFVSGECAILTSSSASYAEIKRRARFEFAVAELPYYDDFKQAPQNTLIGGAGLWLLAGQPKAATRGAARFLAWLSRPEVQAEWHQKTGYVPLTKAAYELSRQQGFYESHPGHEVAVRQLLLRNPTRESKGIRLPHFRRIRAIVDEELEAVWQGSKTPLEALNAAVTRGNALLQP